MEPVLTLTGITIGIILAAGMVIWLLSRRQNKNPSRLEQVEASLERLFTAQELLHRQLDQRLQTQERALGGVLNERLDAVSTRIGESLAKTSEKNTSELTALRERLAVIDAAQKDMSHLSRQVMDLQDILANKQARGRFGEERLEDIIRDQLPSDYCRFQETLVNGKRVDCLITLPPPTGPFAIDAKFPLEDYRAVIRDTLDQDVREKHRKAFATSIKNHITHIAEKYIIPGETADFALMFVPSEAIYAAIHTDYAALIDNKRTKRVLIVSPTTLWAVVGTMRAIIRDQQMREQAGVIQKEVATLLEDTQRITKRIGKLRQHFDMANRDIQEIEVSNRKIDQCSHRITRLELSPSASLHPGETDLLDMQGLEKPET